MMVATQLLDSILLMACRRRRMYGRRFEQWGVEKYLRPKVKEELCQELPEKVRQNADISNYTPKLCGILLRHCKEKLPYADPMLIELLRSLSRDRGPAMTLQATIRSEDSGEQAWATDNGKDHNSEADDVLSSEDVNMSINSFDDNGVLLSYPPSIDGHLETLDPSSQSTFAYEGSNVQQQRTDILAQNLPPSMINHWAGVRERQSRISGPIFVHQPVIRGRAASLENLLYISQRYYQPLVEQHERGMQVMPLEPAIQVDAESQSFWTSVKTAIYLFKKGYHTVPLSILHNIGHGVSTVCQSPPVTLLREFLTTLSMKNTEVCPILRKQLLQLFASTAYRRGQSNNLLYEICVALQEEWVSDEALTTVLLMLYRVASKILVTVNDEAHEINRTHIQLLRRTGELAEAESKALAGQAHLESHEKGDSMSCRLLMSERLYLVNLRSENDEALKLAQEIVFRAQRDEGVDFPTRRTVYEIEDLAEACERSNKLKDAVYWLRVAFQGAMNQTGDKGGTMHIYKELTRMETLSEDDSGDESLVL